jgi:NTE family protein
MVRDTDAQDVLIVQLNPLTREGVPTTPQDISDRLNEIVFNSSLVTELRFLAERNRLVANGELSAEKYPPVRLHMVHGEKKLASYAGSSRLLANAKFLRELKELGRARMDRFLRRHKHELGVSASFHYDEMVAITTERQHARPGNGADGST